MNNIFKTTISLMMILSLFVVYIGNLNTFKFHYYGCRYERQMKERNRFYSESKQKLLEMGMVPCKVCRP